MIVLFIVAGLSFIIGALYNDTMYRKPYKKILKNVNQTHQTNLHKINHLDAYV